MHESATHGPPLEKTPGLVVELLGNLLTNLAPLLGLGLHRLGIDDFLDHRQVGGQPRWLGLAGPSRALRLAGHNWPRFRNRWSFGQLQQLQLRHIELFAAGTKHPAHQQIHLLAQQLVFAQSRGQSLLAFGQLLGQFGFARCHSLRDPILCRVKCSKIFENISLLLSHFPLIPRTQFSAAQIHSISQQGQRLSSQAQLCRSGLDGFGPGESAFLQALGQHP
jgi:hypothetical protein